MKIYGAAIDENFNMKTFQFQYCEYFDGLVKERCISIG